MSQVPQTKSMSVESPDYATWDVMCEDKPSGCSIKAETRSDARRKLAIASNILNFSLDGVSLK